MAKVMVGDDDGDAVELPIDGVLDLHSFAPADVGGVVAEYLDACLRLGLTEVRIIHGKGRGTLRRTVHTLLDRNDSVVSYHLAGDRSGWGATVGPQPNSPNSPRITTRLLSAVAAPV